MQCWAFYKGITCTHLFLAGALLPVSTRLFSGSMLQERSFHSKSKHLWLCQLYIRLQQAILVKADYSHRGEDGCGPGVVAALARRVSHQ